MPGPNQFFELGAMSILREAPEKEGVSTRGETTELNLEKSDLVFDRQPEAFRSSRAHQRHNGDLTEENFPAHNH